MTTNLTAAIKNATSLDELLSALNAAEATLRETESPLRIDELVDLSSLPTFGGEEPKDTAGVWSWDADRLLVGEGEWEIVSRAEWAER